MEFIDTRWQVLASPMGLFNRGRRGHDAAEALAGTAEDTASGRAAYDARLIEHLKAEHDLLLGLLGEGRRQAAACDFSNLAATLGRLKRALQEHVLVENLRLYAYLDARACGDQGRRFARNMRMEMLDIGRRVNEFVTHFLEAGVDHDNVDDFEYRLMEIEALLAARIRREEETLYPLYVPRDTPAQAFS